ncbi:hypothetical protein C1H46_000018 [Malus baccata]|uniref:Uncharacterized protein n=1 Tax=Malus baccata TaxID=106549 RepID=A0A540NSW0_MALBA|nr:hypothetical protein C1H46_000018 [Malus baccata]
MKKQSTNGGSTLTATGNIQKSNHLVFTSTPSVPAMITAVAMSKNNPCSTTPSNFKKKSVELVEEDSRLELGEGFGFGLGRETE